ncbi:HAD family hydrolase [Polaribacter gangjinensis]|uniref:ABC transporter ATP-binding protein n=1 Tax=Polaribacter gangjinensis TaxID=574710 RepID=A0A2S7W9U7_9FLAO|nr:HAD family phosphatase [Polaribacter gangjinensis]PQJ74404.1 ABC transporter ATP-binding protein [Polaribacter gangjinensis]
MTLPTSIKCIIFDMDGVVIDSEEIHKKAYFETFNFINVDVTEELYKTFTGSSTLNAFQKLVAHFQLDIDPEELVLEKRQRYVNYFENDPALHLVHGVKELIEKAYQQGITLILASSSAMENINRVFNRFQLNDFFKAKISGADLKASKPHPEIFEKAASLSGFSKENCVVIEDSDNGIQAANDAGIFVFGFRNPLAADQTLEKADLIIDDFSQIYTYL